MGLEREVAVPDIGEFKNVEIIEVLVKPGDVIKPEDSLITLESDKAAMEVPSSHGGTVKSLLVKVGDRVSKGTPVLILTETEAAAASSAPVPAIAPPAEPEPAPSPGPTATAEPFPNPRPRRQWLPPRPWRIPQNRARAYHTPALRYAALPVNWGPT